MRLLLVNPWIADFAAYNFWMRPLGLYALAEWLWQRGADVALVDCLSPAPAPGKLPRTPVSKPEVLADIPRRFCRYGISPECFAARVRDAEPFDAALVTSAMAHWYPGVRWAVAQLRSLAPGIPIVLGGVYASLWPEHARAWSGADRVFPGHLPAVGPELARFLGLPLEPVRPFRPWHDLGLHDGAAYTGVRTARGCPFRCSYCASPLLSTGFEPSRPDVVIEELVALSRLGVRDVAFYDDALLVDSGSRLLPILERVVDLDLPLRFHTPNGLHARFVTHDVATWMARSRFSTVRLGLETVAPDRQLSTGGKVSTAEVAEAVHRLLRAGLPRAALGVYLLVGLPGQSLEEVREGVVWVRSLGIRPHLAEFSPIPGTPEWERLVECAAIPADLDPLRTNNSLFCRIYSGYPQEELDALHRLTRAPLSSPA
jgi:pyruvate-formate lyase-activating enzyme